MIKVNFIPKTDIEEYLNDNLNITIYNDLTDFGRMESLFDPLGFFNLLYEQLEIVRANKHKPLSVRKHFQNIKISQDELYSLLVWLTEILDEEAYTGIDDNEPKDAALARCLQFIIIDFKKVEDNVLEHWTIPEDNLNHPINKYSFRKAKIHLETLPDINLKIKYLIEIKNEYRQDILTSNYFEITEKNTFDQKCDLEIAKLREISALELQSSQPKQKQQFDRFTNSQIVLIFYYFFKLNGLVPRVSIDIAPIAKFIHLITGKDFKTIPNSDFYKKLQTVPNFKSDKELISDLEVIKPLFKMVQLNEIVKMIDNEIEQARTEINQNRKSK